MAYGYSYEEKNNNYRRHIRENFSYLTQEISLANILPHLHSCLHPSDYETLHKRIQQNSDWDCNPVLLRVLTKQEYWWRAFRKALIKIERSDIVQKLGWKEETFDFGPGNQIPTNRQKSEASNNRPEKDRKPNKKEQTLEEFTNQKLGVYTKQNDLAKVSNPTTTENCQPDHDDVESNLLSNIVEKKKLNTDFKISESEIHPAVRKHLPQNLAPLKTDENEKSSRYVSEDKVIKTPEDELNLLPFNLQSSDKKWNTQSFRSVNSAPSMCAEPGAVANPPDNSPGTQIQTVTSKETSTLHHSLSAPIMDPARSPYYDQQQYNSVGAIQELHSSKKEGTTEFKPSMSSVQSSIVQASVDLHDRSRARQLEIDLRERNLACDGEDIDSLQKHDKNLSNPDTGANTSNNVPLHDRQPSDRVLQEILPSTCQSNMASMTTNDDVIKPSVASTVDPKGVSRGNKIKDEKTIRHTSSNLNREPDNYVTGLHSYGSEVASSIQSDGQRSIVLDTDQTNVKEFGSVTLVNAFDDWDLNPNDLDPSSIERPDAMRLGPAAEDSGSSLSVSRKVDDNVTAEDGMNLQLPAITQNSSAAPNSAAAPNTVDILPRFDSLLGNHQNLPNVANVQSALSDLPLAQTGSSNVPDLSELLSHGSSVDPSDYAEPGAYSQVSVAFPPASNQLQGAVNVSVNESRNQQGPNHDEDSASNNTALNETDGTPPSFVRRMFNSFSHQVDSVVEKIFPASECS